MLTIIFRGKMTDIKYKDENVYKFEISQDDKRENRCQYIHRVSVHPSIVIGGVGIGRCNNEALPGMLYCYIHTTREAMAMYIRSLYYELQQILKKLEEK